MTRPAPPHACPTARPDPSSAPRPAGRWRSPSQRLAAAGLALLLAALAGPAVAQPARPAQRTLEVVPLAVPGSGSPARALYNKSFALVIGASGYTQGWSRLPGVVGDVQAVREALRGHGFEVSTVMDPTREQLDAALRQFVATHGQDAQNRLLVYFAGHGHTLTTAQGVKRGYIVPVDAPDPRRDPAGFRAKAISMETIENHAKEMEAKHALFVLDSCFSGTVFHASRSVPDNITDLTTRPVRQFITAGDADQVVPDRSEFRRQFVAALADGLADTNRDGYITASELGSFLHERVTNYSRGTQTPVWGKIRLPELDKGDVVFVNPVPRSGAAPSGGAGGAASPIRLASGEEVEQEYWDLIKTSRDAQDFRDYLQRYPQGRFAVLAQRQLRVLGVADAAQPALMPQPAVPHAGEVLKDCADCPALVVLPRGGFDMGSPGGEVGREGDEGPVRRVRIQHGLAVGRHEVTKAEFRRFVAATRYATEAERNVGAAGCYAWDASDAKWDWRAGRSWREPGWAQKDNEPVVCVSWNDAQAYLKWLNEVAPGKGFRLLSEAEWEYAARAGTVTRYPWGDDLQSQQQCQHANGADETKGPSGQTWNNKAGCSDGHWYTAPVGSYGPNGFGLYDMHGNVWEWVQDMWHADYKGAPTDGREWTEGGDKARRVVRGGSWYNIPRSLRSAFRIHYTPGYRYISTGFRIARTF